jgi:hypothetical protein
MTGSLEGVAAGVVGVVGAGVGLTGSVVVGVVDGFGFVVVGAGVVGAGVVGGAGLLVMGAGLVAGGGLAGALFFMLGALSLSLQAQRASRHPAVARRGVRRIEVAPVLRRERHRATPPSPAQATSRPSGRPDGTRAGGACLSRQPGSGRRGL